MPWRPGDRISASVSGARSARTTATTRTPGRYFSHDQARSRAYRWGEDGIAGISDDKQRLCLALALWNERDPILKERLFGLTNAEGNHGEDVKEYYFYLDNHADAQLPAVPLQVPAGRVPLRRPGGGEPGRGHGTRWSTSCIDTGVFDDGRYFDVEVEHAKAGPEDIVCRVTVHNRSAQDAGAARAADAVVPQHVVMGRCASRKPRLARAEAAHPVVRAEHHELGVFYLHAEPDAALLFCENETNSARVFGAETATRFVKDGIGDHVAARRGRRQPRRRRGRRRRRTSGWWSRPAGRLRCGCGSPARARRPCTTPFAGADRADRARGGPRRTSSTRPSRRRR